MNNMAQGPALACTVKFLYLVYAKIAVGKIAQKLAKLAQPIIQLRHAKSLKSRFKTHVTWVVFDILKFGGVKGALDLFLSARISANS